MSLPALRAIRARYPKAHIAIQARPWVADLYRRERFANEVLALTAGRGMSDWHGKWQAARDLQARRFDCAILLPNSFDAALLTWAAGIPTRIGYNRDGRGLLLTDPIRPPLSGEIPGHERFYYLELLKRAGLTGGAVPDDSIYLDVAGEARASGLERFAEMGFRGAMIGVSPGAAYGSAKRWLPERFAASAAGLAKELGAGVALFGTAAEAPLCAAVALQIRSQGVAVHDFAGQTSLLEFIDLAAACGLHLTNDSGAMHVSSALHVPTVAMFGATDHVGTGPFGTWTRVVIKPVHCSPCLLRECPIGHDCMTGISVADVIQASRELLAAGR